MDCVAYLDEFKKFKATVETSFVTLERLVYERGLNKIDCLEMLDLFPRMSPDPQAVKVEVVKPVRRLWKSVGRPRKDGTPAQPRFFKIKSKTPPVYDSDSYKSKSSDDENYCRRSDNEEWNPDMKNVNVNKKYKLTKGTGTGKRGRPKKILEEPTHILNEMKKEIKVKPHNGMLSTKSEQMNGNHTKIFVKRPRGRPPKTQETSEQTLITKKKHPILLNKNKVLQKPYFSDSNISSNDERDSIKTIKKGRGRPRKDPLAPPTTNKKKTIQLVVNNKKLKLKKRMKNPSKPILKSIIKKHKKRGRPPKNPELKTGVKKLVSNHETTKKRKRHELDSSMDWTTETEDVVKVESVEKERQKIKSDTTTSQGFDMIRKNYKDFSFKS